MEEVQQKRWVFPSCELTRIACHGAAAARVAYDAARRRIEALGGQYSCSLTMGVLDGQSILVCERTKRRRLYGRKTKILPAMF